MATLENNVFTLNKYVERVRDGLIGEPHIGWKSAWFGGGWRYPTPGSCQVERMIFASDTSVTVEKGQLPRNHRYVPGAVGNLYDCWWSGGDSDGNTAVDRVIFSSDTSVAVAKGPLSGSRSDFGPGCDNDLTDGWISGGMQGYPQVTISSTERIIFASDTSTAVVKGPLSIVRYGLAAHGNTYDGWFGGGNSDGPIRSTVDRIIFASDTSTAVAKGPLSATVFNSTAHGNLTDGWFAGGRFSSPSSVSIVDRIIFASDTSTAVVKGPLGVARFKLSGAGNATDGWFSGGYPFTTIERVIFASDTLTAVSRGPLIANTYGHTAA